MVAQVTAIRYKAQHKSPLSLPRGVESKFAMGSHIAQLVERPAKQMRRRFDSGCVLRTKKLTI